MKVGENPQRGDSHNSIATVRVFVVVYLPHLTGFFSEMETILNLSLDSLERSVDPLLGRVTLISNACCPEVEQLLQARKSLLFDQIIINQNNLGKIDGLLSACRGALEEVVVVSDCDVLFMEGWLGEILKVFTVFPEAASVSPIASPRRFGYESRTTLLGSALLGQLSIKPRMPAVDFERMTEGSTDPQAQNRFLDRQVTISRNGYEVGIAGGHQCIAFRRQMIQRLPTQPCKALLEPHADRDYLDRPPDVLGYWRLSTPRMMAYHMGNTTSKWMLGPGVKCKSSSEITLPLPTFRRPRIAILPYSVRRKLAFFIHLYLEKQLRKRQVSAGKNAELKIN